MTSLTLIALLFAILGVFLESIILLRNKFDKETFHLWLFITIFSFTGAFFVALAEPPASSIFESILILFVVYYSLLFSFLFRKKILRLIDEQLLLIWSLVFLYDIFFRFNDSITIILISTAIVLVVVINAYVHIKLSVFLKGFFYVLFLFYVVYFTLTQFIIEYSQYFIEGEGLVVEGVYPLVGFFAGMAFLFLVSHAFWLFQLIPLPDKNESYQHRFKIWREDVSYMVSQFSEKQTHPIASTVTIFFYGSILVGNAWFEFVSPITLITFIIASAFPIIRMQEIILKNITKD